MNKYLRVYVLSAGTISLAILALVAINAAWWLPNFELYAIGLALAHFVASPVLMVLYGIRQAFV
jgi:hypothetical protein